MRNRISLLLLLLLFAQPNGSSQSGKAEIALGTTALRLGMSKDTVIARLAKTYRVEPCGSDFWWCVHTQPPYSLPDRPFEIVGNLGFESEKLVYVLKRHFEAGSAERAPALADAFQIILTAFVAEQGNSCTVATTRSETPRYEQRRVTIQCGLKVLVMDSDGPSSKGVLIEEVMGVLPEPLRPKPRN